MSNKMAAMNSNASGAQPLPHLRQPDRGEAAAQGGGREDEEGRRQDAAREHLASISAASYVFIFTQPHFGRRPTPSVGPSGQKVG